MIKRNFYVLTGGPGSGKTTLINALKENGYTCVEETGRKIIQQQTVQGGDALPWKDAVKYADLMLEKSINDYIRLKNYEDLCFFDRGIPDVLGYVRLTDLPENPDLFNNSQLYKYNTTVFVLPPWDEIYRNDNERKQDFQTAIDTFEMMRKTYSEIGYKLVEVPCTDVFHRLEFILDKV
ncbi:MAG TPA: ATPase [Dysgonomonas sp.]|nr:ATPase [Dysgonomonas sp.]